jgi:polar amino acid transport system permease protein
MSAWERFVETFFKPARLAQFWPDILKGVSVMVEIAAAVVLTGLTLGLLLAGLRAYRILPINCLIVVCVLRVPGAAAARGDLAHLLRIPQCRHQPAELRRALAGAVPGAGRLRRGNLLGRHHLHAQGPVGGRALDGLTFSTTLAHVVLPQAIRLAIPPLTNRTIAITKNTALGTVIGVGEILNQATTAQSFTGNATPLMMGAIAYVALFVPVVALGRWIETPPGGGRDGAHRAAVLQP